jgi:hypothetical protein
MFWKSYKRLSLEGVMPERAILRLKREKIALYQVKKTQKNRLQFTVEERDCKKVFALYKKVWYHHGATGAYSLHDHGFIGFSKKANAFKKRLGFLLGALLFCMISLYADAFVFGVEIKGSKVYRREVLQALEEHEIKPFHRYQRGKEDLICAKLLAIENVEFCSVQKSGARVVVEIRTSPFPTPFSQEGDMLSLHGGVLRSLTVLRGTPLKKTGDPIKQGEPIVGGYFYTQSGEYKGVKPIARASIACVHEQEVVASDETQAFAIAYLELSLNEKDEITQTEIVKNGETFHVKIYYTVVETINF